MNSRHYLIRLKLRDGKDHFFSYGIFKDPKASGAAIDMRSPAGDEALKYAPKEGGDGIHTQQRNALATALSSNIKKLSSSLVQRYQSLNQEEKRLSERLTQIPAEVQEAPLTQGKIERIRKDREELMGKADSALDLCAKVESPQVKTAVSAEREQIKKGVAQLNSSNPQPSNAESAGAL